MAKISANGVMSRAWAIFRETYRYPLIPFSSIGRPCFRWALCKAWSEAKLAAVLAATPSTTLQAGIDRIDAEIRDLRFRAFSVNITKRETELREQARPLITEMLRRSVAAFSLKLAA